MCENETFTCEAHFSKPSQGMMERVGEKLLPCLYDSGVSECRGMKKRQDDEEKKNFNLKFASFPFLHPQSNAIPSFAGENS